MKWFATVSVQVCGLEKLFYGWQKLFFEKKKEKKKRKIRKKNLALCNFFLLGITILKSKLKFVLKF